MSSAATSSGSNAVPVRLLVVVVNFRTPDLSIQCLESLAPEVASTPGVRVTMVDNCSGDDSAARIREKIEHAGWQNWVQLIETPRNGGFAYGNNRGIEAGLARFGAAQYILHLNSDTIVHPGCLAQSLQIMDADPTIGAMSARLLNGDGSIQNVARRFPTPARLIACALGLPWRLPALFSWADTDDPNWDRTRVSRDVDWLGGAYLLVRGDLLARIGGLSEAFFFYGEDIEFGHRVWRSGLRCRYEAGPVTTHLGGSSSDPTRMAARHRSTQHWGARYTVQRMCYGRVAVALVRAVDTAVVIARMLVARVRGSAGAARYQQLRATFDVITGPLPITRPGKPA